jgi:hypothetical protein
VALPTGGTITTSGLYTIHTFTADGTFNSGDIGIFDVLMCGGGGSGGASAAGVGRGPSGGGAGEYIYEPSKVLAKNTNFPIVIGLGGAAPASGTGLIGGNTTGFSRTARGGGPGRAGNNTGVDGGPGGSGGGGSNSSAGIRLGGASTAVSPGIGNKGGDQLTTAVRCGASGGGATGAGLDATDTNAKNGGTGQANSISGSSVTYCTGGQGGNTSTNIAGTAGANPGDGGGAAHGGANTRAGGAGADGIVIVRYLTPLNGSFSISGVASSSVKGSADKRTAFSSAGVGALNFVSAEAGSVFSFAGAATVAFEGNALKQAAFSSSGLTTAAFVGAPIADGVYNANGIGSLTGRARVVFNIQGIGDASFVGQALIGSNANCAGEATVNFVGSSYTNGAFDCPSENITEFVGTIVNWSSENMETEYWGPEEAELPSWTPEDEEEDGGWT